MYIYIHIYRYFFHVYMCICRQTFKLSVQACGNVYIFLDIQSVHRSTKGWILFDFDHEAAGSFGIALQAPNLDSGIAAGSCKGVGQPDVRSVSAILCKCWGNTLELSVSQLHLFSQSICDLNCWRIHICSTMRYSEV